MKKILTILALSVFVMAFSSCKKDYTCECTVTYPASSGIDPATSSSTINETKSKAKDACDNGDSQTTTGGVTVSTECELK